jgi:Tol biopolymer transport system component/serine/threonine protein kinase
MQAERWQQVQELYLDALEVDAGQRAAFLREACAGDEELRREVESLLTAHEDAQTFLQAPAAIVAAEEIKQSVYGGAATPTRPSPLGRRIGHYQILSALGAGGMGEVFLAHDSRLGRKVALKLLPGEFTRDRERIQRFKHEARAVSSLNHPNIVTVFEIGQDDELHFIATEFIDGQTLRQQISEAPPKLLDALEVAIQTTNALTAAHEAGIVHRDIKPENIMRRRDGFVKVLDFGLAKLLGPLQDGASTSESAGHFSTDPGRVVGTPRYMSPEQVRGEKVDARTDIFSLGVVLYEMIAGRPPFAGATPSEVIGAILHVEPMPLARFAPDVPPELERIVKKTLRKERDERYQSSKDLQLDLKSFKAELEFAARLASTLPAATYTATAVEANNRPVKPVTVDTTQQMTTTSGEALRTVSSAEYLVTAIGRHKRGAMLAVLGVLIAGLAFAWWQWRSGRQQEASFRLGNIDRLTTSGKIGRVALAPDGKEIVYSVVEAGQQSLWLMQVDTRSSIPIVPPDKVDYVSITFSPDGNFIYYVRREQPNAVGVLYQATKHGVAPRQLRSQVDSPITLSPDGKQLAFVRRQAGEFRLMTANADGGDEKTLAVRKIPDVFRQSGPAWSPDGTLIACPVEYLKGASYETVIGVRVNDGVEVPLTTQKWEDTGQVAWLSDGTGLLLAAKEPQGNRTQIWSIAWPSGAISRVTQDLSAYYNLSLSANAATLATVERTQSVYLWVAPSSDVSRATQITRGTQRDDGVRGLTWTPDGKLIYRSSAGGSPNIWMMQADGTGERQLSANTQQNLDPMVAPDGSYLAWTSGRGGVRNIWRMNLDGSNLQQLTDGEGEWFPQFTPDGKWLVYQSLGAGAQERLLRKKSLDSGAVVQLTEELSFAPVISPDGKLIACNYRTEGATRAKMIAVIPVEGGPPKYTFELPGPRDRVIRWTPDGRALAYIETKNGVSNLWSQPLTGGQPKQLTHFTSQEIFNFAWSRDGQRLAFSRGEIMNEVALISALR